MSPRRMLASQNNSDKANNSRPDFLAIGKLRRPHGVQGEILMDVLTDFPERISTAITLYIGKEYHPIKLRTYRWVGQATHTKTLLVSFDDFNSPEEVGVLRNQFVYISINDSPPLPEGEYYHHQLIGKNVVTEDDKTIGLLTEIIETGANDVAIIRPESGPEILIPLIEDVLLGVDENAGVVHIHLLTGILPDEE